MKRILKNLLAVLVLTAALAVSAFAVEYTHCADALNELGIFKGSAGGSELDRAPTRLEAGVMLVRLLGKEDEAKALAANYTAPFTDVKPWAYGYVQYLFDNGLSAGQGGGKFGSDAACKDKDYATFLLRALGYTDKSENPDFTWANSVDFAAGLGITGSIFPSETFLRDNMAAMSYSALATPVKGGDADLLAKLVSDGAIADAKGYDKKFEAWRAFNDANAALSDVKGMSFLMDMDIGLTAEGENLSLKAAVDADAVIDENDFDKTKMSMLMNMEMEGETMEAAVYYTDGAYYMDMDGEQVKVPMSIQDLIDEFGLEEAAKQSDTPLCMLSDASVTEQDGATVYKVSVAPDIFSSLFDEAMDASMSAMLTAGGPAEMSAEDMAALEEMFAQSGLSMDKMDLSMTVKDGELNAMNLDMGLSLEVLGQKMGLTCKADIKDIETGITDVALPDNLDAFVEAGQEAPADAA